MPTDEPNSPSASESEYPLAISSDGTAIAISEFIKLLAARETVMGVAERNSGAISPFGERSLPFATKNSTVTATVLTKQPIDSEAAAE